MFTKKYDILRPLVEEPWRKYTFKELEKATQKKSVSYLFTVLQKLTKNKLY